MQSRLTPIIDAQTQGHDLPHQNERVEFHFKTNTGKLVSTFEDIMLAREWEERRAEKHGNKITPVDLFRVTIISEKL